MLANTVTPTKAVDRLRATFTYTGATGRVFPDPVALVNQAP